MNLLETAKRLAELAEEEARRMNVPITISVVGHPWKYRSKAPHVGSTADINRDVGAQGLHFSFVAHADREDDPFGAARATSLYPYFDGGGRYVALGGGVPLRDGEEFVAGVGVSGGTTEQDTIIVEAAFRKLDVAG